ncbi:two-component regulator propeller domain-containing protein [Pseudomonas sp. SH1-B]
MTAWLLYCGAALADADIFQQLEHRRWAESDDIPGQIGALAETLDGYLWLGTGDSLFRFDGLRFRRYLSPNGQALGIVSSLLATDAGLWVGLRNGSVTLIPQDGALAQFDLHQGVIYALASTPDGSLWAAANDGLMRFDGSRWQRVAKEANFAGDNAYNLFVDRQGLLWVASERGLHYLPPGESQFIDTGIETAQIRQIAQAADGSLWLAQRDVAELLQVRLQQGQTTVRRVQVDEEINGLLPDRLGGLWLASAGAGLMYAPQSTQLEKAGARYAFQRIERFSSRDGLSADYTLPLLEDSEGNLWVGTQNGLDRFSNKRLTPAPFLPAANNMALVAGGDGSLWVGSSDQPVMRLADGLLHEFQLQTPINSAMRDLRGNVWMAGPEGVWRSQGTELSKVASLPANHELDSAVRAMAVDSQGDLWLSLNRQGLFVLRQGQWQAQPPVSDKPSQRMPVSAALAPDGRLWLGYRDNLIVTRDASGERRWGEADGLQIGHVTAMAHLQGHSWVAGQHGIARFDGQGFQMLPLPDNGFFDNIYALIAVPAEQGEDLWLHGKGGIFQLPANEVRRALQAPNRHIRYRSFGNAGGLANDPYQVLPLPTAVRDEAGRLWFVTRNGVNLLDPQRQTQDSTPPRVKVDLLMVDGEAMPLSAPPQLAADSHRLVIGYSALSLSAPEGLHFLYRLDGFDEAWHPAGTQREAIYTGLAPGDYRFRVQAVNQSGVPSQHEAQLAFSIAPEFYRRPLFIVLVSILLLVLMQRLYQGNMRRAAERLRTRLEERHAERERIARELHDTLLQGVQGLILQVQAVADNLPAPQQPSREQLEKALDRAEQMIAEGRDRVRDLRDAQRAGQDLPVALLALDRQLEHSASTYRIQVLGNATLLHPVVQDELYQIAREAVANAFRHAQARNVRVVLNYSSRQFELRISDDGSGLATESLASITASGHWGLQGMHERAHKIGALLHIHSEPERGCDIRVSLPAELAYRDGQGWRRWLRRLRKDKR